jgi:undecaprenyl-diphosphatase
MTNTQAIVLGFVQGLTEYLPVSSSAHLVLVPSLLGWQFPEQETFVFDVLVQLGTLVGIFAYFLRGIMGIAKSVLTGIATGKPLYNREARLGYMLVIATIPAAVIGLIFKDQIAGYFSSPLQSCYFLIVTGFLLVLAEWWGKSQKAIPGQKDALLIGFAQSFALLPGISRSGATISAGMLCGLSRKDAAFFSFLMSIPVMIGASLLASLDLIHDWAILQKMLLPLVLGFITAAITGYAVIRWFMGFLAAKRLMWFAYYCFGIGSLGIMYWS